WGYAACIYLLAIVLFFLFRAEISEWMLSGRPAFPILFALALCFLLFPVIPFKIIIGMFGFMYGPLLGALISWCAAVLASIIVYLLFLTYFRETGIIYLAKFKKLDKLRHV